MTAEHGTNGPQEFDLEKYHPFISFVPRLRSMINAEGLSAGHPIRPKDILYNSIRELPMEAVAPAINATIARLSLSEDQGMSEADQRSSAEKEVYEYLSDVIDLDKRYALDESQKELAVLYKESEFNLVCFDVFRTLEREREGGLKFFNSIRQNYESITDPIKISSRRIPIDTVEARWITLRESLHNAREAHKKSLSRAEKFSMLGYPQSNPELSDSVEKTNVFDTLNTIIALRSVPAEINARVLWDRVLSEKEKAVIRLQREAYQGGKKLIEDSNGFSSYKDSEFRNFFRTHKRHDRRSSMLDLRPLLASKYSIDYIEMVLVGRESELPSSFSQDLRSLDYYTGKDPDTSVIVLKNMSHLIGLSADTATIFLEGKLLEQNFSQK